MKEMKWIHYVLLLILLAGALFGTGLITGAITPDAPVKVQHPGEVPTEVTLEVPEEQPEEIPTEAPTEVFEEIPTEAPTEALEEIPTEAPTEAPAVTGPQVYQLTFVGDCILGCNFNRWKAQNALPLTVGEDYAYPFSNVLSYFEEDTYSFAVLENPLGDLGKPQKKDYAYRGEAAYTRILTENSVEAVTLANNHIMDYGQEAYDETKRLLEEAGLAYAEQENSTVITTEEGLTIGLYAVDFIQQEPETEKIREDIRSLKESGVDLVVCAFHWGANYKYKATEEQIRIGHLAVDSGADVVWGSHPHVLQPIEQYNGGVIYYSLGCFVYGGNSMPQDFDTAIIRQEVIRETDGTVRLGELTAIPCSISSDRGRNNYQPTPYDQGSEAYNRVLSKLNLGQ